MYQADQKVKNQAILRHQEREVRQKREIPVIHGPGLASAGTIFDCNRKSFGRMLKSYWDRLYVGWNPLKLEGRGCWEVWQTPTNKTPVLRYHNKSTGDKIYTLEYQPSDFVDWIADLEYLSYDFIGKLKKMDAWENKQLVSDHDYQHSKYQEKQDELEEEHIKNVVRDNRKHFRDLLDYVQSGYEPTQFFTKNVKKA